MNLKTVTFGPDANIDPDRPAVAQSSARATPMRGKFK